LLRDVAESCLPTLRAHGLELDVQPPPTGLTLAGDRFLLQRALHNLVENASAFAPAGTTIEVAASWVGDAICIRVSDRGPGIPDYAGERVFERFYSLPRPRSGERSSGLGLPFVREVATLHGGQARLGNRAGGGATAEFVLPRSQAS